MTDLDVISLTSSLVRMDTINPPGHERECAVYLAEVLEESGFQVTLTDYDTGRTNLIGKLGGRDDKLPICLTGHLDTVPLGSQPWSVDPFLCEIREGRIYGRGTTDMKGGVAAMVVAATELADKLGDTAGVELVFTGGEETGCEGAKALIEGSEILSEIGAIVVGEPTSNRPLIGHKGALWLNAICSGLTAHGSTPELGDNAVYKACRAVNKLEEFRFDVAPLEYLGGPTLNVGRIHGGLNINSVPDRAHFDIDIRTIPGQDHQEIRKHLLDHMEEDVALETILDVASILSDASDPWIKEVFDDLQAVYGTIVTIEAAKYFTDCSVLTPAYGNPPTLILGPGEASLAHVTDEYCEVDKLIQSVDIYRSIVAQWCELN